jgi:plasmid stabilization system protein ParE
MRFYFLEPAKDELNDAIAYYEAQRDGLGQQFADEVRKSIQRILDHPEAWTQLSRNTRCCRMNRFPFGIVYQARGGEILIVAIMHLHRKPEYWKDRL